MPTPALASGARHAAPLKSFTVRVTLPTGQRIKYTALAGNSIAALEAALETHGVTRIVVSPSLWRVK